jgi:hypothetical protein
LLDSLRESLMYKTRAEDLFQGDVGDELESTDALPRLVDVLKRCASRAHTVDA